MLARRQRRGAAPWSGPLPIAPGRDQAVSGFEVFLQQAINGITVGSYLALIALGLTLIHI